MYKIEPQSQNTFHNTWYCSICLETLKTMKNFKKTITFIFYNMYKIHNSYFVNFVYVVFLVNLYILYYTCRSLIKQNVLALQTPLRTPFTVTALTNTFARPWAPPQRARVRRSAFLRNCIRKGVRKDVRKGVMAKNRKGVIVFIKV